MAQGKARPRKRRGGRGRRAGKSAGTSPRRAELAATDEAWREGVQEARRRPNRVPAGAAPERPRPPWHPIPLAEILILAGAVSLLVGLGRGPTTGGRTPLLLGIVAVGVGTIEFSVREHVSGFRSHTIMLALLPVVVFHTLAVLVVSSFTPVTREITFVTLIADVAVFAVVVRLLRLRMREGRQQQVSGVRRSRR